MGYQGLELEDQRIEKEKADRDRVSNEATHPISEARVFKSLLQWKHDVWKELGLGLNMAFGFLA